ncbi:MAG: PilZ domain-containing protein [Bauldia sp.]
MEVQVTPATAADDPANRRVARRMRTLKKATIVIQGGYSVFDCVIRNISETGALLQVGGLGIPSHFELKYDAPVPRHPCTVRWRTENAMGVSFDDVPQAA